MCRCCAQQRDAIYFAGVDYCLSDPCKNRAICVNTPTDYTCQCPGGYEGKACDSEYYTSLTIVPGFINIDVHRCSLQSHYGN